MASSCLPTLTLDGFVTNKQIMLSKIWEYFLTSEYSQSNVFHGDIFSFKYIMATASGQLECSRIIEENLSNLFRKYYETVLVDVIVEDVGDTGTQRVKISVTVKEDDKSYYLADEVEYTNGKIENFETALDEMYSTYTGGN